MYSIGGKSGFGDESSELSILFDLQLHDRLWDATSSLVHLAEVTLERLCSRIRVEVIVSVEEVCAGFLPPVVGCGRLRVPPGMFCIDHIGCDTLKEPSLKLCPSIGRFQVDPVSFFYAKVCRTIRMNLYDRIRMPSPQRCNLVHL